MPERRRVFAGILAELQRDPQGGPCMPRLSLLSIGSADLLLSTAGLAVCCPQWPAPDGLAAILGAALALRPERWASYHDGHGADRAAALVDGVHGR